MDDHDLARAGLRSLLETDPKLEIVGEAESGGQAIPLCQRLQPDVAIVDVRLPDTDGLALTAEIKRVAPTTRVMLITAQDDVDLVLAGLQAGAAAFVRKGARRNEIVGLIHRVLNGETALEPELATMVARRIAERSNGRAASEHRLSPRELEVLRLVARGLTNQEIGSELMLSVNTVKTHIEHILAKLGVIDRTQASVRAAELGLLDPTR